MTCRCHGPMTLVERARAAALALSRADDRIDDKDVDEAAHLLAVLVSEMEALEGSPPRLVWPSAPGGEPDETWDAAEQKRVGWDA